MIKELTRSLEASGAAMLEAHNAEQLMARQLWALIAAGYRSLTARLSTDARHGTLAR